MEVAVNQPAKHSEKQWLQSLKATALCVEDTHRETGHKGQFSCQTGSFDTIDPLTQEKRGVTMVMNGQDDNISAPLWNQA